VPRETPLSSIHLRGLTTLEGAGAVILFAAPGFYHQPASIDDLVDFVVARCLDHIGLPNELAKRWGEV
jgi:flavin prenyltransferase